MVAREACVVAPGGRACMVALGGVWFFPGGMHGFSQGAYMVFPRGVCMVFPGGHAWFFWGVCVVFPRGACIVSAGGRGACMVFTRGGMRRIRQDTVNERAVRILLECILVFVLLSFKN